MPQGELKRIDQGIAGLVALRAAVERCRAACWRTLEYQAGHTVRSLLTVRAHRQYGRRDEALILRHDCLVANWDAVAATLRQFDPGLPVDAVEAARPKRSCHAIQQSQLGVV
jgi:hypothetical protein